jgi:guanylate kinase
MIRTRSSPGGNLAESTPCRGVLFVLEGPSAVGKNTVMRRVMGKMPELRQLPTITTRAKRQDEQQGREHFFVTPDEFHTMIARHALVEYQEVYPGTFYGTPRQPMQEALDSQKKMIADIDVVGASKVKEAFSRDVVLIFVAPPSLDVLEARMRQRGDATEEEIAKRIARAPFEMKYADKSDYRVVNDRLENTVETVVEIIHQELTKRGCAQPISKT